jgi:hypothetical protein
MRSAVVVPNVADPELIERLQSTLRKNSGKPMMVRELADGMGVSLTTAGKYVEICQAAGIVSVQPFATAKLVSLSSTGKGGAGVR